MPGTMYMNVASTCRTCTGAAGAARAREGEGRAGKCDDVYIDVDLGMAVSRYPLDSHPPLVASWFPSGSLPFLLSLPIGHRRGHLQPGLDRGAPELTAQLQHNNTAEPGWC